MKLFLAIPVDAITQQKIASKLNGLKHQAWTHNINWIPTKNYHITLTFIGNDVSEETANKIHTSMMEWFSEGMSTFDIQIQSIRVFPSKLDPRFIVASLDSNIMMQCLVREVEEQLKPLGFRTNKQAYRPHITLGKLVQNTGNTSSLTSLYQEVEALRFDELFLKVTSIALFESQIANQKTIYHPLKTMLLDCYD